MSGRVPLAQRFHEVGGRARGNIAALDGEKTRIPHRRAVRSFQVALCQLRQIGLVQGLKRSEFGYRISAGASRPGNQHEGEKTGESDQRETWTWCNGFTVHGR